MSKYHELALSILKQVGGSSNIDALYHCMTRLRFKLKNENLVDLDSLKGVKGVLGAQFTEDTLQVIIGTTVDDVYNELLSFGNFVDNDIIQENLDTDNAGSDKRKNFSVKSAGQSLINVFSNSMGPLVPLFVALGMVNVVAAIIGPTILNMVSTESDLYNNFYYIGQGIIYFLPIFVAITASKYFKTNLYISVALAGIMLYPDLIAALGSEAGFTFYGIAVPNVAYSGQMIPILLVVAAQGYVEKLINKIIPDSLKVVGVGFLSLAIMAPLSFIVLGPIGFYIGSALVSVVMRLYSVAGPLATALVGAFIPFLTAFGIGRPIFFAALGILLATGSEYAFMPIAMVLNNFLVMGITAGYIFKAKGAEQKQVGVTCLIASALGGVSEPSMFGIIIPDKKTYLPIIISGAISGLYLGIMKVGYFQFGPSNILSVLGFVAEGNKNNFIQGTIASGIAFVLAFITMMLLYKNGNTDKNQIM